MRETVKGISFIRNIVKMTDPADDRLRMPIPPASLKIKKPKKKNNKDKKLNEKRYDDEESDYQQESSGMYFGGIPYNMQQ